MSPVFKKLQYMWIFVVFALTGTISGLLASRLYKLYNGTNWLVASAVTGLSFPALLLVCFYVAEIIDWLERSSSELPQFLIFESVLLAGNFNFLLVMIGCYIGFRMERFSLPVKNARFKR